ncbi:MAG: hypothetical protein EZS28_040584 [Streblomastix strix]|uniref:Uncharacterized protein n=1 Tax=Streblomastix strix TaxID=222440 RepID=A0A5J4U0V2_9EUKA|nr:MAG: hypothetical protein EZS28_040584 [Streblomastix strix]
MEIQEQQEDEYAVQGAVASISQPVSPRNGQNDPNLLNPELNGYNQINGQQQQQPSRPISAPNKKKPGQRPTSSGRDKNIGQGIQEPQSNIKNMRQSPLHAGQPAFKGRLSFPGRSKPPQQNQVGIMSFGQIQPLSAHQSLLYSGEQNETEISENLSSNIGGSFNTSQQIKELIERVRQLEAENQKEKKKIKQSQTEMDDMLKIIQKTQIKPTITKQDWIRIKEELEQDLEGSDSHKEQIRLRKSEICREIVSHLIGKRDDEQKKMALEVGIVGTLLQLFSSMTLEQISLSHVWAFFIFTQPTADKTKYEALQNIQFSALMRLLDHPDVVVMHKTLMSIFNINLVGANTTLPNAPHPHFNKIAACQGIEKLYSLFKKSLSKYSKDTAALCLSMLFRAKEISNEQIKHDVITYFKTNIYNTNDQLKMNARTTLEMLSLNAVNRLEVEKDGFKIPK